jgi:hypothetical protein
MQIVQLNREVVEAGKSRNGGWSEQQLLCLGVAWPPPKGWIDTVVGTFHSYETVRAFLDLRDKHLPPLPQLLADNEAGGG